MLDIASYSENELHELIADAESEIARRVEEKKTEALEVIEELALQNELGPDDFAPLLRRLGSKAPTRDAVEVRYRHPGDPSKTWAGRGRKPKWLEKELERGAVLERFRVS